MELNGGVRAKFVQCCLSTPSRSPLEARACLQSGLGLGIRFLQALIVGTVLAFMFPHQALNSGKFNQKQIKQCKIYCIDMPNLDLYLSVQIILRGNLK